MPLPRQVLNKEDPFYNFGKYIKEARRWQHLTRQELAGRVGVTEAAVGIWENRHYDQTTALRLHCKIQRYLPWLKIVPVDGVVRPVVQAGGLIRIPEEK